MKTNLFEGKNLTPQEILDNLKAECADTESNFRYKKAYSEAELSDVREEYTDHAIRVAEIKQKIADLTAGLKLTLKEEEKQAKEKMEEIKIGGYWVTEEIYLFPDYENRIMARYNREGVYIDSRPMTRTEKQLHIELKLKKAQ